MKDNLDDKLLDEDLPLDLDDELFDDDDLYYENEGQIYENYQNDEESKHLGEEQFDKTLKDKDYYKNRNEELQKELEEAKAEAEKDEMTIPKEEDKDASIHDESNANDDIKEIDSSNESNGEVEQKDSSSSDTTNDDNNEEDKEEKDDKSDDKENQETKKDVTNEDGTLGVDKDGRPIIARNADGSTVVQKNEKDHKQDQRNIKNIEHLQAKNKIDDVLSKGYAFNHPIEAAKKKVKEKVAAKVVPVLVKALPYVLIFLGILLLAIILIAVIVGIIMAIVGSDEDDVGAGGLGYYDARCQEITVTGEYAGTYDIETYVAGVVQREVGFWNNLTVDEVFAIAARSYGLANADDNCTIANSTLKQTFTTNISSTAMEAAQNTKGIVIVGDDGSPKSVQYDAFAEASHDNNYYTLKQKNQKIPTSWVHSHISQGTLNFYKTHNHGHGISQWGAYYLATEENKNYEEILSFYIDSVTFKSTFIGSNLEGVPDYALDSGGSLILRGQSLDQFLLSKGSSLEALNSLIAQNVSNAGYGNRAGVVSAAVTLIGELNKYGARIPYFWGGGHGDGPATGALAKWGSNQCNATHNKTTYNACGLDCSGFVSWALNNGGVHIGVRTAGTFHNISGARKVSLNPKEAVLQPGDIMESNSHVVLVVGISNSSNSYLVAESGSKGSGVYFQTRSFAPSNYWGVDMSSVYGG